VSDVQATEQAQTPARPVSTMTKHMMEEKKKNIYDPDNLNTDEKKIINTMLHRATIYEKPKSGDEEEADEWN
jgi:hypothetical protein